MNGDTTVETPAVPGAILDLLAEDYGLSDARCTLISRGLNDSYRVESAAGKQVLRIYRDGWRNDDEIAFELGFLRHLRTEGVSVAEPLPRIGGELTARIEGDSSSRIAALFRFAPGRRLRLDETESHRIGAVTGRMHRAAETYVPSTSRFALDTVHLLEEPVRVLDQRLHDRREALQIIAAAADLLREQIDARKTALDWGPIHGDLHDWNAHVDEGDGTLTLIDFDCCGFGWRSYDIAVFRWAVRRESGAGALWKAFLEGYSGERRLTVADLDAVPVFMATRDIWLAGVHAANPDVFGPNVINDGYLAGLCGALKEYLAAHAEARQIRR